MAVYECNEQGWEKFMKEKFRVEKGGLSSERKKIEYFLDLANFKKEGRDGFINFLDKEGYLSKFWLLFKKENNDFIIQFLHWKKLRKQFQKKRC